MPRTTQTKHQTLDGWEITFTEEDHSYIDNAGRRYTSVTTLVHDCFEPFDAVATSERMAARDGTDAGNLRDKWKAKAEDACAYGTRVHSYAEALMLGQQTPDPIDKRDRDAFGLVDIAVAGLKRRYDVVDAEMVIFDPLYTVAGTIDLIMRDRANGINIFLDWKTNAEIKTQPFGGRRGTGSCCHVPDCNYWHYALQLSIYQFLCEDMEIIKPDSSKRALIHIPPGANAPAWIPLPYMRHEAEAVVEKAWRDAERKRLLTQSKQ